MRAWKKGPDKEGMLYVNTSLEVQILLQCNFSCSPCDAFSNYHGVHWIKKGTMTLKQIKHFAAEMRDNNASLGRVRLLGGEPTMHPKLEEICKIMQGLQKDGHVRIVEMVTNASNMEKANEVKPYLNKIRRSDLNEKNKTMVANLVHTPKSLNTKAYICSAPSFCGLSLNAFGYFPCSSGAGLARLLNDVPRWQRTELPKKPFMEIWPDLLDLCSHCYHSLPVEKKQELKCGPKNYEKNTPNPEMWSYLSQWINGRVTPRDWKVYGEETLSDKAPSTDDWFETQ